MHLMKKENPISLTFPSFLKESLDNSLFRRFADILFKLSDPKIKRYVIERKRDQGSSQDKRKSGKDSRNGVFQVFLKASLDNSSF